MVTRVVTVGRELRPDPLPWLEREVSVAQFLATSGVPVVAPWTDPGELPTLVGPLTDIATALTVSSDATLHRAAAELVPLAESWPRRPLHGDAHTGNVLMTPDGPRWTDFEDVCVGPVEWDLASMTITVEALAAYPGPIDRPRLDDCRDLRRLQILASLLVGGYDEPALHQKLVTHLDQRVGTAR